MQAAIPSAIPNLVELLARRDIRVEIEELLRLQTVLERGDDWGPQRLTNALVGILATSPREGPLVRDAVAEWLRVEGGALDASFQNPPADAALNGVVEPAPESNITPPVAPRRKRWLVWSIAALLAVGIGVAGYLATRPTPAPAAAHEPDDNITDDTQRPSPPVTPPTDPIPDRPLTRSLALPSVTGRLPFGVTWFGLPLLLGVVCLWRARRALADFRKRVTTLQAKDEPQRVAAGPSLYWLAPEPPAGPVLLSDADRDQLIWGIGRIEAQSRSNVLDEAKTVDASIDQGGYPAFRFLNKERYRRVWVWLDVSSSGLLPRRLTDETRQALFGHGLDIEIGRFWGVPEKFQDETRRSFTLESLEAEQDDSVVVILTDGDLLLRRWEWRDESLKDDRPALQTVLRALSHNPR